MIDRRTFISSVVGGILAAPLVADAQQTSRVRRIGYLSAPTRESVELVVQAFLRSLRELGWIEGQNLLIEYRWADGKIERLPDLAAELVRETVELIVAPAGTAALAAKKATSSIPIVMAQRRSALLPWCSTPGVSDVPCFRSRLAAPISH